MKILLRLSSDLTTKSDKVRARFVGRLLKNLRAGMRRAGIAVTVERQWSRLYVETDDPCALEVLARLYGISSFSPIDRECRAELAEIVRCGVEDYASFVAGKRFAVRARRVGVHGFTSMDIQVQLGAALAAGAAGVDLRTPEVEVHVEVRADRAHLYSRTIRGPAGLPLGVSGKLVCLISGGFDSAVAAWMMQKRGVEMEYLFCNLAGGAYERSVATIAAFLATAWGHGTRPRLHVLDFQPLAAHLRERVKPAYAQVVLKRLFYRAGERLAREVGAPALLTGECVAQVSSQTLTNLCAIETAVSLPLIRPLIGFDKEEITGLARRIGSFDLCAAVQEYCQLVPDRPVTACNRARVEAEETGLDPAVFEAAWAGRRILALSELSAVDLVMPYVYTSEVPPDAVVIDCRPASSFAAWHYDGALHFELHDLLAQFKRFDKTRTYVVYCPIGLQSAVAAEAMQKAGYQAYGFLGGTAALSALTKTRAEVHSIV